jgi:pyruvate/2-oxoacid:ferredoxin oxidoreductase beta subunit
MNTEKRTARINRIAASVISDADKNLILKSFREAEVKGHSLVDCYIFAAEAWQRKHPESSYEYAAKQAVQIILETRTHKLVDGLMNGERIV